MSYTNLRNRLTFMDTRIEIEDSEEYKEYAATVASGKSLPAGITYETGYDTFGNPRMIFYREATNEEIKELLEIQNAKSLKRTGDALHFFKMLTMIGLVGSIIIGIICILFGMRS